MIHKNLLKLILIKSLKMAINHLCLLSKNATFQCCKQDFDAKHRISLHSDDSPFDVWDRYYRATFTGTSKSHCKNCKVSADSNELYIYLSSFINLDASAIIIAKDDIRFLDSNCFFNHCRNTTGEGAAIYFDCKSSIIQHRICSTGCSTDKVGAHSYCNLKSLHTSFPNLVIESSFSSTKNKKCYCILYFYYGNTGVYSSNFSNNEVYMGAGFQNHNPRLESITNFSTFCHNRQAGSCALYHATGTFKEYCCNFVDNPWNGTDFSMIQLRFGGTLSVENCSIVGPYGTSKIFGIAYEGTFTVTNCNIDNINEIGNDINTNNINETNINFAFNLTLECEAENFLQHIKEDHYQTYCLFSLENVINILFFEVFLSESKKIVH